MRTPFRLHSIAMVFIATLSTSCTIAPPQVSLTAIRRSASSPQANAYDLEFSLRNSHHDAVELESWSYSVSAPDGSTYGGTWAALAVLPAETTKTLVIPAVLDATPQTGSGANLVVSGEVGYRDPGNLARLLRQMGLLKSRSTFTGNASVQDDIRPQPPTDRSVPQGAAVPVTTPMSPAPAKQD